MPLFGSSDVARVPHSQFDANGIFLQSLSAEHKPCPSDRATPVTVSSIGVLLVYDKAGNPSEESENLGSVLTERGSTLGRHKLFLAFTYQRFIFKTIDNITLSDLPSVYQLPTQAGSQPGNFIAEFAAARNIIGLNINQYAGIIAFGLTRRIDVSVTIPFERISLSAGDTGLQQASFPINFTGGGVGIGRATADSPSPNTTIIAGSASGLGDVLANVKGSVINGEKSKLAFGMEVRFPTGDEYNLLGTGAYGFKPYAVFSRLGRVTPHVNLGYQWNGFSALYLEPCFFALSNDPKNCAERPSPPTAKLPGSIDYSAGVDVGIVRRLTAIADFIGQYYLDAPRVTKPVPASSAGISPLIPFSNSGNDPNIAQFNNSTTIGIAAQNLAVDNLALGLKWNPAGKLILSANALIRLDDGGLRPSRFVPLVGVSYRF